MLVKFWCNLGNKSTIGKNSGLASLSLSMISSSIPVMNSGDVLLASAMYTMIVFSSFGFSASFNAFSSACKSEQRNLEACVGTLLLQQAG